MIRNDHRQNVCDAAVFIMSKRKRSNLVKLCVPDEVDRNKKAVDLMVSNGATNYALEHTRVESFDQQIRDDHKFMELFGPLETILSNSLPTPGHYVLSVAVHVAEQVKNIQSTRESLIKWIRDKAMTLKIGPPSMSPPHCIREIPSGVPFEVTLCRQPGLDGKFMISRYAPNNIDIKRHQRIQRALDDKCPKLEDAKSRGSVSVLIIESNDIALANFASIGNILIKELLQRRGDIPDEVYFVETDIEPWAVFILKDHDQLFPDVDDYGPHYIDSHTAG